MAHSLLLFWVDPLLGIRGGSALIGVIEVAISLAIAALASTMISRFAYMSDRSDWLAVNLHDDFRRSPQHPIVMKFFGQIIL